jgi:hypothetical protein
LSNITTATSPLREARTGTPQKPDKNHIPEKPELNMADTHTYNGSKTVLKQDFVHEDSTELSPAAKRSISVPNKSTWNRIWPVIACGAGLFSDGYLNGVSNPSPIFNSSISRDIGRSSG